ncbi:type II toxin-antitoxin system RelE/ParE family toxin [Escherichia coli]|nr:type II toxin-antitoxin system RelE/ParE family toxin [Escherichia coli]
MMEIFWTMLASQDRKRIREYIAEQNLMAAIELDERIGYSASSLFSLSFISVQVHDNIITV